MKILIGNSINHLKNLKEITLTFGDFVANKFGFRFTSGLNFGISWIFAIDLAIDNLYFATMLLDISYCNFNLIKTSYEFVSGNNITYLNNA